MSAMPRSQTSASLAHTKALANCAHNYHQWHPTFALGEKVCTVCGAKAYCPRCVSKLPGINEKLVLCALHRREEERQVEA